jgi:AbrB family looped-hinge helix DNA binding protein
MKAMRCGEKLSEGLQVRGMLLHCLAEDFLGAFSHPIGGRSLLTETVVDERGRVLIPEEIRESAGLTSGAMVAVEKARDVVVIKPLRRRKRGWRELCGLAPERTGKPKWPTPEEIKGIWR